MGAFSVSSTHDLKPYADLLDLILAELEIVVDAEQKFLVKTLHIQNIDNDAVGSTSVLSEQMRAAMRPIFERVPEQFQAFARSCSTKGNL